jgi:hypothetical protein
MKKTLVIHPQDVSTDFLSVIYKNIPFCKVITKGTEKEVIEEIEKHDRIIMMGHGTPYGLMSIGRFGNVGFIINQSTVPLLRRKECIFIWCNANMFVERFNLKGFYSGMFVSEVGESHYCGCPSSQYDVDFSNNTFSEILGECIEGNELEVIYECVKKGYGKFRHTNDVVFYNHQRLYLKK